MGSVSELHRTRGSKVAYTALDELLNRLLRMLDERHAKSATGIIQTQRGRYEITIRKT